MEKLSDVLAKEEKALGYPLYPFTKHDEIKEEEVLVKHDKDNEYLTEDGKRIFLFPF